MALGELTRQLADANVNVDLAYTTFGPAKIVIAADDLKSARRAPAGVSPCTGRDLAPPACTIG